jgi:hypothetical protein
MRGFLLAGVCCVMAWPSVSQAFPTCDDAWNYGWNTANIYSGAIYNRLACNPDARESTEIALARTMSRYVATNLDTDAHLVCMYSGLYHGLLGRASIEYAKCYTEAFQCLSLVTIGRYATAVLAALFDSLAYPSYLGTWDVRKNLSLSSVELTGDSVCSTCNLAACEDTIFGFLEDNSLDVDADLVAQLVNSNCVCAE